MPRFSKESQAYFKERIRGVVIIRPQAGPREICEFLRKSDPAIELSEDYVGAMRKKILGERAHRVKIANTSLRIAEVQDKHRLIDQLLWEEALDKSNPAMVRIMALTRLSKSEQELLQIELDTGFINQTCEHDKPTRERRLTTEQKKQVIEVMKKWKFVRSSPAQGSVTHDQDQLVALHKDFAAGRENLEELAV